ncbi:hypothetical protein cypCar_00004927 [Cyprinus carpio]|nr:hypothetical protein cypCar_00004927 [Cyprinus carpio]
MSSDQGGEPQLQEEAEPGPKPRGEDEITPGTGGDSGVMVTAKGAGLNPNAKVWQEIPATQSEAPVDGTVASPWSQNNTAEDNSVGKQYTPGFSTPEDNSTTGTVVGVVNGMDPPDQSFPVSEHTTATNVESKLPEEQPVSEETLRESLKKELEFCFSRENLSKDLYLISQMDSDQFVPIWTIASMEGIKVLTTDTDLILDVLRSSPMVQVDEKGEKVRPNHKRCIIILREVPETTPVEEVEALFKNDNCPKVISVEFAHNNNWYITFQSDTDAQQAYKYLREEVKTFQGKPIMARIKAINTFFAKNGYRSLDCSVYPQQSHTQSQYSSPLFMQPVYSPQQQYPLYGIVPPTWTPSPTPYFETPLAPFPNSGFVNGFSSPGHYKTGSTSLNLSRPFSRNRNHVKPQTRANDGLSSTVSPVALVDGLSGLHSPQPPSSAGPVLSSTELTSSFPHLASNDPTDDGTMAGRGRRTTYRGTRRRREDDRTTRPVPLSQVKVPSPKFDLAASNFPPLPGCSASPQGEPVLENRLSDVVRGLNREKQQDSNKESAASPAGPVSEETVSRPTQPVAKMTAHVPDPVTFSRANHSAPNGAAVVKAQAASATDWRVPTDLNIALQYSCAGTVAELSTVAESNVQRHSYRIALSVCSSEFQPNNAARRASETSCASTQVAGAGSRNSSPRRTNRRRPSGKRGKLQAQRRADRPVDSQGLSRACGRPQTQWQGGFKLTGAGMRRPPFGHRGSPQEPQASSATPAATPQSNIAPSSTPALEPRKLSYAEVCQRPPKDPPPPASTSSPNNASTQPLRELRVNTGGRSRQPQLQPSQLNKQEAPSGNGGTARRREGRPARELPGLVLCAVDPRPVQGGSSSTGAGYDALFRPSLVSRPGGSRHTEKARIIRPPYRANVKTLNRNP